MKTKFTYVWMAMVMVVMLVFTGCKDDKEKEVDLRDSFTGVYKGTETFVNNGVNTTREVTINVSKSTVDEDKMILSGKFYGTENTVEAILKNSSFTFMYTTVSQGVSVTVTGYSGSFGTNTMKYSYSTEGFVSISFSGEKM